LFSWVGTTNLDLENSFVSQWRDLGMAVPVGKTKKMNHDLRPTWEYQQEELRLGIITCSNDKGQRFTIVCNFRPLRDGHNENGIGPLFTSTRCPTRGWGSSGIPALQAIQCGLCLVSILRSFGVQTDFFLATCQSFSRVLPLALSEVTIYEVAFENAGSRCEEYCSPNRYQRRTV
jgi:hypothetical protein